MSYNLVTKFRLHRNQLLLEKSSPPRNSPRVDLIGFNVQFIGLELYFGHPSQFGVDIYRTVLFKIKIGL